VAVTSELVSETTVSGLVGVRMGVERPVNYLLKEKAGSTMLDRAEIAVNNLRR
jgi:hypothetical protein